MQQETKQCQNCKKDFIIEPEDFDFYVKIKVPAPTFCPDCRMQRRFAWRNERVLHRNVCAKTGKKIITGFAPDSGLNVYDREIWWSDSWDPMIYGVDYDFQKPFFSNSVISHRPLLFFNRKGWKPARFLLPFFQRSLEVFIELAEF